MSLGSKTNHKLNALVRMAKYFTIGKRVQFNYCPLIWMCHSKTLNNKTIITQEQAFKTGLTIFAKCSILDV